MVDGAGKARGFRLLFVVLQQLRHGIGQRAGPQIVVQGLERAQGGIAQGLRFFRRLRLTGAGLGQAGLYLHGNFVKVPALVRQALRDARSQLTQLRGMGGTGHNQQQALVFQLAYLADGAQRAGNSAATAY